MPDWYAWLVCHKKHMFMVHSAGWIVIHTFAALCTLHLALNTFTGMPDCCAWLVCLTGMPYWCTLVQGAWCQVLGRDNATFLSLLCTLHLAPGTFDRMLNWYAWLLCLTGMPTYILLCLAHCAWCLVETRLRIFRYNAPCAWHKARLLVFLTGVFNWCM